MDDSLYVKEVTKRLDILHGALATESDRGMILVGASAIDEELTELLQSYFSFERKFRWIDSNGEKNAKVTKMAFRKGGPLHELSAKNDLAYLLGLINEEHEIIRTVASIRNKFAHKLTVEDFSSPEIADLLKTLTGKRTISRDLIMGRMMEATRPVVARVVILQVPGLQAETRRILLGLRAPLSFPV